MDKCPVCGTELDVRPSKYNKNPDGEFLVAMHYMCPKDGVFVLRLGSESVLSSNELARKKAIQFLRPLDGGLRILAVSLDDSGLPRIHCVSYKQQA